MFCNSMGMARPEFDELVLRGMPINPAPSREGVHLPEFTFVLSYIGDLIRDCLVLECVMKVAYGLLVDRIGS